MTKEQNFNEEEFEADELLTYNKDSVAYAHENYVEKSVEKYITTIFQSFYRDKNPTDKRDSLTNIFNILDGIYDGYFSLPNEDNENSISDKEGLCNHLRKSNKRELAEDIEELDDIINSPDKSKLLTSLRSRLENECAGIFKKTNQEIKFVKDIGKNTLIKTISEQRKRFNMPSPNSSASETTEDTLLNEPDDYSQTDSRPNSSLTNPRTENSNIKEGNKIR